MGMKNLPPAKPMTLDASLFSWKGREGVAFASDLPRGYATRVYDDACDFGFLCRSPKTGVVRTFAEVDMVLDRSGEAQGWIYETTDGIRITVFNT